MTGFIDSIRKLFKHEQSRNVALVLGGGGARGFAHIGAIEVLQERGYHITSVAGTSMGALVGGLYAAGKLEELKRIVLRVNRRQILSLINISPGLDHIATADKLSRVMEKMTAGVSIEDLPIPFSCSASDLVSGKEHVFSSGKLSAAIRASISIPCVFSPERIGNEVLVDGSVHNTLPLNRVERHKDDVLIAVNASATDAQSHAATAPVDGKPSAPVWDWLRSKLPFRNVQFSDNYLKMAMRVSQVTVQNNTLMAIKLTPPDICVDVPMDSFGLMEFDRGREIIAFGRRAMEKQLDSFEAEHQ